jgi:protein involved in polysaccharide export with SLBB domain
MLTHAAHLAHRSAAESLLKLLPRAVAVALLLIAAGCQTYHDVAAFQTPVSQNPAFTGKPYVVAPPDVLAVSSTQAPELNVQQLKVAPEGTVDMPLIGPVHVAGMTVEQIEKQIQSKASEYYKDVDIVVRIDQFRSKHIFVFGEVTQPGRYDYTGSDTVLEVLARAQPTRLADPDRIQVLRPNGDGKTATRMTVELGKWYETGIVDRDALLADGDIIYVPPNGLARMGLALQQVLLPIQPAAATMKGPTDINDSATRVAGPKQ